MHPYPTLRLTEAPGFLETRLEGRPTREALRYPHRSRTKRALRRRLKRHDRQRAEEELRKLAQAEEAAEAREWAEEAERARVNREAEEAWCDWRYAFSDETWEYNAEWL